jgi:hypothetical protein
VITDPDLTIKGFDHLDQVTESYKLQIVVLLLTYTVLQIRGSGSNNWYGLGVTRIRFCINVGSRSPNKSRVADPHSFHPDPDPAPAFQAEYRSGSNTDPDPIRFQGFKDQKLKKITAETKKLIFF